MPLKKGVRSGVGSGSGAASGSRSICQRYGSRGSVQKCHGSPNTVVETFIAFDIPRSAKDVARSAARC